MNARVAGPSGPSLVACAIATVLALAGPGSARAQEAAAAPMQTTAEQAFLMDGATGTVLLAKNADAPFAPASLAKLMTVEIVFDAIRSGEIDPETTYPVSEHAWRTGGAPSGAATMFAALNSRIPVADLVRGMIVQSANDAAIILAEGLEGSEDAFADRMNERARELGLAASRFVNPTGLEAAGQTVSARDLVMLARHIRTTYPELYAIYSEPAFEWNGIFQRNRNPLLGMEVGATGMGTGRAEESGYGLVGVTEVDGRVTYLAIAGLDSAESRAEQGRRLFAYAQDGFASRRLFAAGQRIGAADVFGGSVGTVALEAPETVEALLPAGEDAQIAAEIRYSSPLIAPVEAGDAVAQLNVMVRGETVLSRPLVAASNVPTGGFAERAAGAIDELATGWMRAF